MNDSNLRPHKLICDFLFVSFNEFWDVKMKRSSIVLLSIIALSFVEYGYCLHKRCIKCRSRGELGSCGDPISFNVTDPEAEFGIHVAACPSGWCGKLIEGTSGAFPTDDYGAATQRMCLQRPPNDYEERCAYTLWNYKKVYMCFCYGDLCNSSVKSTPFPMVLSIMCILILCYYFK